MVPVDGVVPAMISEAAGAQTVAVDTAERVTTSEVVGVPMAREVIEVLAILPEAAGAQTVAVDTAERVTTSEVVGVPMAREVIEVLAITLDRKSG